MPHLQFPGESAEYRTARNALLDAEVALRRQIEAVAAQRRALPPGGEPPEDFVFERIGANERPETVTRCAAVRTHRYKYIARPNDQSELYDCARDPLQKNNLFGDDTVRRVQTELHTRLMNWYIDTSGVPPSKRDPRGAPVLDRAPELGHVATPSSLLDH